MDNVLFKLTCKVSLTPDGPVNPANTIYKLVKHLDFVYSYLIYAEYSQNKLTGWRVEFMISQTNKFNTIHVFDATIEIHKIIMESWHTEKIKYVVGYRQPPLELLLEAFDPLIKKLAEQQRRYWRLEFEDLCQMCRLVICILHGKGYYLHKSIINKSFINYILMHIRKEKYKPIMVSIYEGVSQDGDSLTIADTIVDETAEQEIDDIADIEAFADVLSQKRDIIKDYIGPRQYDQLVREYGNKMTTNEGRKLVDKIKKHLKRLGISEASFKKYY